MIGNVWELTADAWTAHPSAGAAAPDQVPAGMAPAGAAQQVIKGGSFLCAPNYCMRDRAGAVEALVFLRAPDEGLGRPASGPARNRASASPSSICKN